MGELYGGVETGGTWCVCAVGTGPEEIVAQEQFHTGEPEPTLERIAGFFDGAPDVAAVGVGSFGPVDVDRDSPTWGHVTSTPKPGWRHAAVAPVLEQRLDVPVAFDNDVNAAAVAEHRWGAGRDVPSLCYLTIGTGIGGGLLIDGVPRHGLVHPEVGHIRIPRAPGLEPAGRKFPGVCPAHGDCWEGLASGPAMAALWGRPAEELPGDHPAWRLEAEYLALGILSVVLVASPERMIVGGGVMEQPQLVGMVRTRVSELLAGYLETPQLAERIDEYLVPSGLGDRAGVLGAIALAHDLVQGPPRR